MTPDKIMEAQAYAVLFALGGYIYTNIVEQGIPETTYTVNEGKVVADDDLADGDDDAGSGSKVDGEFLIRQKSPYEQKFIRANRSLFSETLKPSWFLYCPLMKIKLKQALCSKLDPSLY